MSNYNAIISRLPGNATPTPLTAQEVADLRAEFPELPEDYLAFMSEVGWGNLGEMAFYSGPSKADGVYGAHLHDLKAIFLFGDNHAGDCYGFDSAHHYQIVALDPAGEIYWRYNPGFRDYILHFFPRRQSDPHGGA